MMYTRAAFYATEPSNAAVYAPVEACGAHEWSCIVHGWRAFAATQPPTQHLEDTEADAKSEAATEPKCEPTLPLSMRLRGGGGAGGDEAIAEPMPPSSPPSTIITNTETRNGSVRSHPTQGTPPSRPTGLRPHPDGTPPSRPTGPHPHARRAAVRARRAVVRAAVRAAVATRGSLLLGCRLILGCTSVF